MLSYWTTQCQVWVSPGRKTELGWAYLHFNRWPLNQSSDQVQCDISPVGREKQEWMGWWSALWLEGETTGQRHRHASQVLKRAALGEKFQGPYLFFIS